VLYLCCFLVFQLVNLTWVNELQEGKSKANPFEDQGDDLEDEDEEADGSKEPLKTTFELNDTLYAEAEIEETDTVFLWLGVRVPISIPIPSRPPCRFIQIPYWHIIDHTNES